MDLINTQDMTNTERLAVETKHAYNSLMSAILCRKQHPSYGYKKADILERLYFLEGLLYAYHLMVTGEASASHLSQVRAACESLLGRNIDGIRILAAAA